MSPSKPSERIRTRVKELRQEIKRHDRLYYEKDAPEVSDATYDALLRELQKLETDYPELVTKNSPTQKPGGTASADFKKVKRSVPMLSLANAFQQKEVEAFHERIKKALGNQSWSYYVEHKLDGLAVEIRYEDGELAQASTRGDGETGEDITANIRSLKSIPNQLPKKVSLEIRGEVFMEKADFDKLNQEREKNSESLFANPRNAAAGSLRQLDPKVTASRPLKIYFYGLGRRLDCPAESQSELMKFLSDLNLPTNPHSKKCESLEEAFDFYQKAKTQREKLSFEIDGVVIKVNEFRFHQELEATSKYPRWAIAYKLENIIGESHLLDVEFQVGRTGVITPVAELEAVSIGGVVVRSATLHNQDEIERLQIHIGDRVEVTRAGDVIPKVLSVVEKAPKAKRQEILFPQNCPSCGTQLKRDDGMAAWRCPNTEACPKQIEGSIIHFISKDALNMDGLGPQWIQVFLQKGLIKDALDLFELTKEDLMPLDRMGEKLATNLIAAIQNSRETSLARALYALGIPYVGETLSKKIARSIQSLSQLSELSKEELLKLPEVGETVAESILHHKKKLKRMGAKLDKILKYQSTAAKSSEFAGMSFVLTGSLEKLTRDEAKERIEARGGHVSSSVSKKTSVVVVGAEPGSKYEKAQKLKIPIWSEADFLKEIKEKA